MAEKFSPLSVRSCIIIHIAFVWRIKKIMMMSRYLDPKADVVFKKIFGDHPHLLISFLNAVLPLPPDRPIVEISYLPTCCSSNAFILGR